MEITATIDGKVKVVTKASVRRHLKLEDSDGINILPTSEIFEQLVLMGHGGVATTVTSLDARQGSGNIDKTPSIPHDSPLLRVNTLRSDEGKMQHNELMDLVTKLLDRVLTLETDLKQTKKVYGAVYTKLIIKVKKLKKIFKTRQARRKAKIVVSDEEVDLEDPSKQGRKIEEIDQDPDISLIQHDADIQEMYEQDMEFNFDVAKDVSTAEQVSTVEEELDQGRSKKQKIGESSEPRNKDVDELSQEELHQLMIIVLEQGMNVEALQSKYPIIDWETYTENTRKYWKIIRVGNHTKLYKFFDDMLKVFDGDDLVQL
nr:hypothetical protein [Tanacetum cinerariifolium]